jgi:hypothetical protein
MPEVMLNRLNNQPLALAEVQIFRLEPNWRGWRAKSRFSEPPNASPGCAGPSALPGSATLLQVERRYSGRCDRQKVSEPAKASLRYRERTDASSA